MKRGLGLVLLAPLLISGCGVEWFPDDPVTGTGNPATSAVLTKVYTPATILAGTNSTLTFTITNGSSTPAQSGLGFTDQLSTALTVTATSSQCGGTVSAAGSKITFSGGQLSAGTISCTITANIVAAPAGSFVNRKTDIAGLGGGLVNNVTDQTLTVVPAAVTTGAVTISNVTAFDLDPNTATNPETYGISADAVNTAAADATVTVDMIAFDANGTDIASTAAQIIELVPAGTLQPIPLSPVFIDIPLADATRIKFWRIVRVTVQ